MGDSGRGLIEWAVAAHTLPGQAESGDQHWVKVSATQALVAVVDGVGHGNEAAQASLRAIATLRQFAGESPLALFERCHQRLRSTRGVVMSLAVFSAGDNAMTWLGVGNVEGVMLHPPSRVPPRQESLLLRPGVLGIRLPRLSASVLQVSAGDLLIFATDGLREGFEAHTNLRDSPQQIADRILDQYGRGTDDALVLVARYLHGKADVTVR